MEPPAWSQRPLLSITIVAPPPGWASPPSATEQMPSATTKAALHVIRVVLSLLPSQRRR